MDECMNHSAGFIADCHDTSHFPEMSGSFYSTTDANQLARRAVKSDEFK